MNRPLAAVALSYTAGIALGRVWLEDPIRVGCLLCLLLLVAAGAVYRKALTVYLAVLLVVVAAAGGAAYLFAVSPLEGGLVSFAGERVYVEGVVVDEPLRQEEETSYRVQVETVETREGSYSVRDDLLVKVYGQEQEPYWVGERLRLRGVITEPRGRRNPAGFDYRFYLQSQGIAALMYLNPHQVSSVGEGPINSFSAAAITLRSKMVEGIEANLPSPAAELLTAVLFGQRQRLPDDLEANFRRAGAGHLMAVSGLHVGLVAAMILGLWRFLGLKGPLPLLLAIILIFSFAYLTGLRPAALRAAVMLSLTLGALLLDRDRDLPTAVAAAALITLSYNPLLLFSVGFQLSYAATLSIIYLYPPLTAACKAARLPAFIASTLAVTLAAQIGVLPISAYHFHHLPLGGLLFNLLLLPLMAPLIGLGLIGALLYAVLPALAAPLLWACFPILKLMMLVISPSNLPGFYISIYPPGLLALTAFYAGLAGATYLYYRCREQGSIKLSLGSIAARLTGEKQGENGLPLLRRKWTAVAVGLLTLLLIFNFLFSSSPNLRVTFIDVGQGAAVLIETPCDTLILVDSGGESPYRGDPGLVGERILLPYLRSQGIRHLDMVVISHAHEDHFGGLLPVIGVVPIGTLMISPLTSDSPYYQNMLKAAAEEEIRITEGQQGELWSCGHQQALLEVLWPGRQLLRGTESDLNNNSLVLRLTYGEASFLFTGDIQDAAAQRMLREGINLSADILQIPHHGGYMSAMPEFLAAVNPHTAVIPVGVNPFGHPHPHILENLSAAGIRVYRTDYHGAVIIESCGSDYRVRVMTDENRGSPEQAFSMLR